MSVKGTGTVNKNDEVDMSVFIRKFESESAIYVDGYGLGTLQIVANYKE